MIAFLSGRILKTGATSVILDVNGVGYRVFVPVSALASLPDEGEAASLHIHTNVREDAIDLFGFINELDKEMFELLITVSGVGPKMALGVLSAMTVKDIASAARDDGTRLQMIPGIGKKTAQRIALEVGDKIQELGLTATAVDPYVTPDILSDVIEGLALLGYSRTDAQRAARKAREMLPEEQNAAVLLKEGLAILSK